MAVRVDPAIVVPILKMLQLETIVVTTNQMGTRGIMYAIDVKIMSRITPTIKGLQPADMTDGYCGYCREKLVDGDGSSKSNPLPFYFLPHRPRTKRVNQTRCRRQNSTTKEEVNPKRKRKNQMTKESRKKKYQEINTIHKYQHIII